MTRQTAPLTGLRGRRDNRRLDPADPAGALATVLAEVQADYDLGPQRRALLALSARGTERGLDLRAAGAAG
jgi:hypothetical protein